MARLTPLHWRTLARALESFGARYTRTRGSHVIYRKPGVRALVFPKDTQVAVGVIRNLIRDLKITPEEFLRAVRKGRAAE